MKEKKIFALGFFDGVHKGHQALLTACRDLATEYGCQCGVVTFSQHPDTLVLGSTPKLINTAADRQRLLSAMGAEHIATFPFDEKLMTMPYTEFLEMLLAQGAAGFVCGADFRFGHKGEGNGEKLTQFCIQQNLPCCVVDDQLIDGVRVSSTHIRQLLENGHMEDAVRFLGHPHILTGEVISGRHIGRTIGVPTANILIPHDLIVPKFGVYACRAWVGDKDYVAVTNIGTRPTVDGQGVTVEPWILDFDGDLYGKEITLEFYAFLRPERKFDSLEELKDQIQKDARQARNLLK